MDIGGVWRTFVRRWREPRVDTASTTDDPSMTQTFLMGLGSALLSIGVATTDIQRTLRSVATALGYPGMSIVVLPTVMIVSLPGVDNRGMQAITPLASEVRFDRAADVYRLVLAAERGELTAEEGIASLEESLARPPRFPAGVRVVGHGVAAAGVALVLLGAHLDSMLGAFVLGTLVGAAKLAVRPGSFGATILPVFLSFVAALLVFTAAEAHLIASPLQVLVPAMVTLLPGAALTTGIQELASGDMVSGSSRLVYGLTQLGLLASGIVAALSITGLSPSTALFAPEPGFGVLEPWVGVVLLAAGFYLYYCGPSRSIFYLAVTLLIAYAAQVLTAQVLPAVFGGFVGAFALTLVAYLLQALPGAPPAVVCFLPAFWLLVPGAAGLIGLTQRVLGLAFDSLSLFTILGSIVAIALGVVSGTAFYRQIHRVAPSRWGLRFG